MAERAKLGAQSHFTALLRLYSPGQPECGEGRELLLAEPVAAVFLVAQKDAQAYGGAVGEFFDVLPSDYGPALALDVLPEGRYAPLERVGALHRPSLRVGARCGIGLGPGQPAYAGTGRPPKMQYLEPAQTMKDLVIAAGLLRGRCPGGKAPVRARDGAVGESASVGSVADQ